MNQPFAAHRGRIDTRMPLVRRMGRNDYESIHAAMRTFTEARTRDTRDEIWLCEHPSVYTLGVAGRAEHILDAGDIPVVRTGRGGQVTYHGPGQVIAYPLIDLQRLGFYVKEYVFRLEQSALKVLESYGVTGHRVRGAPGIYVRLADPFGHARRPASEDPHDLLRGLGKIAALGIKVSRHCTYHGLALNVAMDLKPFQRINPCGYPGLAAIDLATLGVDTDWENAATRLGEKLRAYLSP